MCYIVFVEEVAVCVWTERRGCCEAHPGRSPWWCTVEAGRNIGRNITHEHATCVVLETRGLQTALRPAWRQLGRKRRLQLPDLSTRLDS